MNRPKLQHEGFRLDIHMWGKKISSASKSSETLEHRIKAELWHIFRAFERKGQVVLFQCFLYSSSQREANEFCNCRRSFLVLWFLRDEFRGQLIKNHVKEPHIPEILSDHPNWYWMSFFGARMGIQQVFVQTSFMSCLFLWMIFTYTFNDNKNCLP